MSARVMMKTANMTLWFLKQALSCLGSFDSGILIYMGLTMHCSLKWAMNVVIWASSVPLHRLLIYIADKLGGSIATDWRIPLCSSL